jgi:transcription elongation factor S-II
LYRSFFPAPTRSVSPSAKESSKPSSSSKTSRPIASLPSSSKPSSSVKKEDKSSSSALANTDSNFPSIITPYPETLRTWKSDKANHPGLGDDIRDKCVMLVYDSLAGDSNATKDVIMEKSKAVERGFYNKNDNSTDNTYRQSKPTPSSSWT